MLCKLGIISMTLDASATEFCMFSNLKMILIINDKSDIKQFSFAARNFARLHVLSYLFDY